MFDLLYGVMVGAGIEVSRREVITTFLKKSIFEPRPETARAELLAVPLEEYDASWHFVSAPSSSLFGFDYVSQNFSGMINSLFDAIAAPIRRMTSPGSSARVGMGAATRSSAGINIVSSNFRNTIINAGRAAKMVELTYDGYRRLVEPYKLEYYIRKRDGIGNEYFWGFDTTGGRSGKASIKMFLATKSNQ